MANPQHIEWLLEGVEAWNTRRERRAFDPDLSDAIMKGADLRGAVLRGANLREAYLREANLRGANLRRANLQAADLRGAVLWEADLLGADLREANLREADLREADLREADLRRADLRGADLQRANLQRADLEGADLEGADLLGADLEGADLVRAELGVANLRGADLRGVDLRQADLEEADVRSVIIAPGTIDGSGTVITDLQYATGLSQDQLDSMVGDSMTLIPDHLERPEHWKVINRIPPLPAEPVGHNIETRDGLALGQPETILDDATLSGLYEDLLDAVGDLKDFGNLDNQAPMLAKGVERFLKRLPARIDELDQVRFGAGVQALSLQFDRERPVLEEVAPEKIGHLEAALLRANLIAENLPVWLAFRKDEAETEPVFEARREDVEAILEHAAEALASDPDHFDPSLFERIREYLDDQTLVGYLASKDLLLGIARKTFSLASELATDVISEVRKQTIKNIARAFQVQLGAVCLELAGVLPKQLKWLVDWLEYLPTLL